MADALSKTQCILLAVNLASESQPQALRQLFHLRTAQVLEPELVLRILLTYLPGVTPPAQYIPLISDVTSDNTPELEDSLAIDVSSVTDISDAAANRRLRKLTLLPLSPPAWPANAPTDVLTRFICHRSYRVDEETGLITLLPDLIRPFLRHSEYLQLWSISVLLPLLRLQHEYYRGGSSSRWTLETFEKIDGAHGVELLLSMATAERDDPISDSEDTGTIGRDLRGMVAPWMYGHTSRKRRRMSGLQGDQDVAMGGMSLDSENKKPEHNWEQVYAWMVGRAVTDFPTVAMAIEDWDGPEDVDMGGYANRTTLMDDDERADLEQRYAQAAFAACYAAQTNTNHAVHAAHGVLSRLAELRDFIPPPDLATSVEQLATFDDISDIRDYDTSALLHANMLMEEKHPLTVPSLPSYHLLHLLVYSAYQYSALGHPTSIQNVARMKFFTNEAEQLRDLKQILHGLSQDGKRDEDRWMNDRMKLLWLWNWNIDPDEHSIKGSGPYGDIPKETLEKEVIVAMLRTGNLHLIEKLYVRGTDKRHRLSNEHVEESILEEVMRCYDNASNGNRQRGSMEKADDIVSFFLRIFPKSQSLARASALMAATHSMSFYALTLQHGVPFQPANIRASPDPLSLLEKILEQNPKAYTKLDDLISMGRNLAVGVPGTNGPYTPPGPSRKDVVREAERRVIYMCISAALSSSDFDTAYSYLTSRLQPDFSLPSDSPQQTKTPSSLPEDDISWRAAYLAGRYNSTPATTTLYSRIRLLEQRTELLSLALLLAPVHSLTEILNVYRRVEEEMTALLAQQAAEEAEHDDLLDRQRGLHGNDSVPGGFGELGVHEGRTYNQSTRTVGNFSRGYNSTETARPKAAKTASRKGEEEAPVGLFDLARGAASALGRNAFPLRREGTANAAQQRTSPGSTQGGFSGGAGAGKGVNPAAKKQKVAPREEEAAEEGDEWGAWDNEEDEAVATASSRQGQDQDQGGDDEGEAWGWGEEPVAASPRPGSSGTGGWGASSMHSDASGERVRKRDMVANAVTGGLASGIGWVLGATPVQDQRDEGRR